jgi:hypothetical protein
VLSTPGIVTIKQSYENLVVECSKPGFHIEESIVLNLNPGIHILSIENLHDIVQVVFDDVNINEQQFFKLNSTDLSFRIN